ncbi:hypothetical protein [Fodinibius sp. SL11]|uniref:hypothetical protein n=1 Tax=Fodinibius sp. SL11 TaxID=3425690 RepID=UPI003F884974
MVNSEIDIILWLVLGLFTLGAALLATFSLINVVRLRNVRLSWKTGKLGGYPLFSTLFMVTVFVAAGAAIYRGATSEIVLAGIYGWLGFCWFTSSFLATKRYITDHGIVKNVNEPSQTVAWHQIRDFVETEQETYTHYIFIYNIDKSDNNDQFIRLELDVPHYKKEPFKKLISHKLGRRIRCYVKDDINIQQFKQL